MTEKHRQTKISKSKEKPTSNGKVSAKKPRQAVDISTKETTWNVKWARSIQCDCNKHAKSTSFIENAHIHSSISWLNGLKGILKSDDREKLFDLQLFLPANTQEKEMLTASFPCSCLVSLLALQYFQTLPSFQFPFRWFFCVCRCLSSSLRFHSIHKRCVCACACVCKTSKMKWQMWLGITLAVAVVNCLFPLTIFYPIVYMCLMHRVCHFIDRSNAIQNLFISLLHRFTSTSY